MTVSLTYFLDDLLKAKQPPHDPDSPKRRNSIVIVDDNAQLTAANRMKNSVSFANAGSSHLASRWSSQHDLSSTSPNPSGEKATRRGSTSTCYPRRFSNATSSTSACAPRRFSSNAAWEDVRITPSFNRSSSLASSASMNVFPSTTEALHTMGPRTDTRSRSYSSSELCAPSIPQRSKSPRLVKPKLDCSMPVAMPLSSLEDRSQSLSFSDRSDGSERSLKLLSALGAMAPQKSGSSKGKSKSQNRKSVNRAKQWQQQMSRSANC